MGHRHILCVKKSGKNTPDLRQHVLNAVSVETPRGIRLSKQKPSNKIDGAVTLSLPC